jgi:hypothetical protein
MSKKKEVDPFAAPSVKIPQGPKANRNKIGARQEQNWANVHEVREISPETQEKRRFAGLKEGTE